MKNLTLLICLAACLFCFTTASAQNVTTPPGGANQKASVTQYMGLVKITIDYNSPDVTGPNGQSREGKIWGTLVPHGLNNLGFGPATAAPWRAGANENTVFTVSHDVEVEGKALKAGSYGLHIITQPEGQNWTVIFSNNSTAWGSFFYDESEDALRVEVTPEKHAFTEWLTYSFTDRQLNSCVANMSWENINMPFRISAPNMTDLYIANMRRELQSNAGFNFQGWATAANYCAQNKTNLEEALQWADNAISLPFIGQKNYATLSTKATVLMAMDRMDDAMEVMTEAIHHPTATVFQIHVFGRQLIAQGQPQKALEIFQYNAEKHPNTWPVHVGLARGYSANGKYKEALKHAKIAQGNVPEGDAVNTQGVATMIEKLGKNEDVN